MLKTILVCLTILLVLFSQHISSHKGAYTTYEELVTDLNELTTKHPNKTHLYSIGKSVEGRDLWVLAIANSEPSSHQLLRPEVKLIGNIHGNELPTGEILLDLIHLMLENPENDTRLDEILSTMRVHILVSMNYFFIKGTYAGQRYYFFVSDLLFSLYKYLYMSLTFTRRILI
jgi:hypothetical protein